MEIHGVGGYMSITPHKQIATKSTLQSGHIEPSHFGTFEILLTIVLAHLRM